MRAVARPLWFCHSHVPLRPIDGLHSTVLLRCLEFLFNQVILLKHVLGDVIELDLALVVVVQLIDACNLHHGREYRALIRQFVHAWGLVIELVSCRVLDSRSERSDIAIADIIDQD